ncbi:NAD-dependent epimerase/dehydratase family protein [Clostridium lundense]|uniref:NAD-dependent epimerase/dehydratase family protein n=1 Tax=Clostridium lundense TaxID=319475 RepID=UPI000489521D|nr:NAD-dependent epimerase/dehydratase family protein [Clostridium lundense]
MEKRNIYITGANGFIGKSLINFFSNIDEVNVIGISHSSSNYVLDNIVYSDYKNIEWMRKVLKSKSILIHTAACIPKKQISNLTNELFETNTSIDRFIVKSFLNFVDKFIYFSSISVYGYGHHDLINITEESSLYTLDDYSKSKLYGERLIHTYYKNKEFILRLSSPYGIGKSNIGILEDMIYKAIKNKDIEIYGNGVRTQDYVYISDICKVVYNIVMNNTKTGIYNLATGNSCKISELAKIIISVYKSSSKLLSIDKEESTSVHIQNKKICTEMNVNFVNIKEGIQHMYYSSMADRGKYK